MTTTALDILHQALTEIRRDDYYAGTDRVMAAIDDARRSISAPAGRTPERHSELMAACQAAQREVAKTVTNRGLTDDEVYMQLRALGHIPREKYQSLLGMTIARLESESTQSAVAAE